MGVDCSSRPRDLQFEISVSSKIIFMVTLLNSSRHPDPFYIKEEFAPSDRAALSKRQQTAHNLLAPHMRLLQFLGSHFNASRLGSPNSEKAFLRLLNVTLEGLKNSTGHPLAREIRFQVVLFGLKVLRHSTALDVPSRFLLKDRILSAALSWFTFAPRWSFGGNRLQLKAEVRLLTDVSVALRNVAMTEQKPTPLLKSLQAKESLLQTLIESEQWRLTVWLYPLHDPRETYGAGHPTKPPTEVSYFLQLKPREIKFFMLTTTRLLLSLLSVQLGPKAHPWPCN